MAVFRWRHFAGEIILWAVRWYCRYGISYRELEEMMGAWANSQGQGTLQLQTSNQSPFIHHVGTSAILVTSRKSCRTQGLETLIRNADAMASYRFVRRRHARLSRDADARLMSGNQASPTEKGPAGVGAGGAGKVTGQKM